jgi:hypothetical protein
MTISDVKSTPIEEPAGEYPPRYWWLKRILLACAIVLVLLCLMQWWWWHAAQARLDANIAKLRAAGEPASVADLQEPTLRDADNAAYYLKLAAAKISPKFDSPANSNAIFNDNVFPYSPTWFAMEQAAVANSGSFAADLREARRHPRAQWTHLTSPLMNVLLPHLNQCRMLANHACDYAMLLHFQGDDAEAMEILRDVFAQADAVDQEPFLVSHLVAGGIRVLASNRLQLIGPALTIRGASPTTNPSARPASRQQVEKMIAFLVGNQWRAARARRTFAAERVLQIDYITTMANNQWLLRPMLVLDAAQSAHASNPMSAAGFPSNWPAASAVLRANRPATNPARMVGGLVRPALDQATKTDYRIEEECSSAAISLAVRLYRLDHADALPPTLAALVPNYLPKVPVDPMAAGNKTFGYRVLNGGERAIVYSVGEDGVDDTAAGVPVPQVPNYTWDKNIKDVYHELLRWRPPPSTQPGDSSETPEN